VPALACFRALPALAAGDPIEEHEMLRNDEIQLTELDVLRIERELTRAHEAEPAGRQGAVELETLLDYAAVVPAATIDRDVVTMNSTAVLQARESGERMTITLVYPKDVDPKRGRVSVLSPMGRALIGSRVGDVIRVAAPTHAAREFTVRALTFQPEAHGRFDL
jgi:regulator of nucleoside diphosphate kinase